MPIKQNPTYRLRLWRRVRALFSVFWASPFAQSISATIINLLILSTLGLGPFSLVISSLFFCAQIYNSWLVVRAKLDKWKAFLIGACIVLLNTGLLYLTFLDKVWLICSIVLSLWQYLSLIRIILKRRVVLASAAGTDEVVR